MSEDFAIRRYTDGDRPRVFELIRAAVSDQYANHLMRIWDWKYGSHPLNQEADRARRTYLRSSWDEIVAALSVELMKQWGVSLEDLGDLPETAPYVLLIEHGDRLAAMTAALPQAFMINGERHLICSSCDMAVHPDFRGSNLSMRISIRMSLEHGLIQGWSNRSSHVAGERFSRKTYDQWRHRTNATWRTLRVVPLVKPIDWSYMVHRSTNINLPGHIAAVVASGAQRVAAPFGKHTPVPGIDVFRLENFDSRIDDLWRRASREHSVIAVRDSAYLNWRFNARPDATYVCLAAGNGEKILGYLVYRIVEQDGARWAYIVDFLTEGDPAATFTPLVARAEELMIRDGAKAIVCFMAKAPFRQALRRAGFYPSVFGRRSYMTGAVISENIRLHPFAEVQKWFATMADGDAEMVF
jgi:hypothetical protein